MGVLKKTGLALQVSWPDWQPGSAWRDMATHQSIWQPALEPARSGCRASLRNPSSPCRYDPAVGYSIPNPVDSTLYSYETYLCHALQLGLRVTGWFVQCLLMYAHASG